MSHTLFGQSPDYENILHFDMYTVTLLGIGESTKQPLHVFSQGLSLDNRIDLENILHFDR